MADSAIINVSEVEQFGKALKQVGQQQTELYERLKQQTEVLGNYWQDDSYDKFNEQFHQDIMKKVKDISMKLELFSVYVEKQCQFHRMAMQNRW